MKDRLKVFYIFGISTIIFMLMVFLWFQDRRMGINFFRALDLKMIDAFMHLRGQRDADDRILIVAIDEKSLEELGRWPWRRSIIADAIETIEKGKPLALGLDIVFAEPEKTISAEEIMKIEKDIERLMDTFQITFKAKKQELLMEITGLENSLSLISRNATPSIREKIFTLLPSINDVKKLVDELHLVERLKKQIKGVLGVEQSGSNTDMYLAETISKYSNIALGYFFYTKDEELKNVDLDKVEKLSKYVLRSKIPLIIQKDKTVLYPVQAKALRPNIEIISQACKHFGFFNAFPDIDGIYRHGVLIAGYKNVYLTSLALEMLVIGLKVKPVLKLLTDGAYLELGMTKIPLTGSGEIFINFRGPVDTYKTISLVDVVKGRVPPEIFKDKYVLIGATATAIYDLRPTPFDKTYPGVKVHANIIDNVLNGAFLVKDSTSDLISTIMMILFWLFITFVFARFSAAVAVSFSVGALASFIFGAYWLFEAKRYVISVVYPGSVNVFSFVALLVYKLLTEERTRKKYREAFQRYVSPAVVEEILKDPSRLRLGGEKRLLTVLFSDIRDFTSISENLDPMEVANVLHEFLTPMTEVIFDHMGMLDKYMGDAIMAVFGAPLYMDDHALLACRSAVSMLEKLKQINAKFRKRGLPAIDIGIGINTGEMVVGNMGSSMIFDYTVIGDAVNIGSRLEGLNKVYGTHIIVSEFTYREVQNSGEFIFRELDYVRVKGKDAPVRIYELIPGGVNAGAYGEAVKIFRRGLEYYRSGEWDMAVEHFDMVIKILGKDKPSEVFIERCRYLKDNPPEEKWDGVWKYQVK